MSSPKEVRKASKKKTRFVHGFSGAGLGHASLFLKLPCKEKLGKKIRDHGDPGDPGDPGGPGDPGDHGEPAAKQKQAAKTWPLEGYRARKN